MMMFSVYDKKADCYGTPFFAKTKGEAVRSFHSAVNDPGTFLHRYPGDYDLFHFGVFDVNSGLFRESDEVEFVCSASSLKELENASQSIGNDTSVLGSAKGGDSAQLI